MVALPALQVVIPDGLAATAADVPAERQALVLVRALAYDGNLQGRANGEVTLGVLARTGHPASDRMAGEVDRAFAALGTLKVQGLPIRSVRLAYTTAAALAAAVRTQGVDAIYVCPGLEGELDAIVGVTRSQKVISMAAQEALVHKGVSLGVFLVDGKATIFVNLPASKLEGVDFGSDLLRLARVIK
jgi:hypothetical protein